MKKEILVCLQCRQYMLRSVCPQCRGAAVTPKPAKFSPEDKYGKYRLLFKKSKNL